MKLKQGIMNYSLILTALALTGLFAFTPSPGKQVVKEERSVVAGGIKFNKLSLEKALQKAKETGKLVFIDVYTTWCGPCKQMARTTFESPQVGEVFNKKFINLKIDAENDPDGANVSKAYKVSAYPTLLFLNGDGKLVKKLIGLQSEEKLLAAVKGM